MTGWLEFIGLSLRFDLSTLASLNLAFIVFLLLPLRGNPFYFKAIAIGFVLVNAVFLILNAIDVPFFAFNSRRTSYPVFVFLLKDSIRQGPQLVRNYWPLLIGFGVMIFALYRSFPRSIPNEKRGWLKSASQVLFWSALSVMAIRNSFKQKPLLPAQAFTLQQTEAGHAALNTPFLLFKTTGLVLLEDDRWLSEKEMAKQFAGTNPAQPTLKGYNLVLIILESFATEYTGLERTQVSYTPFLDSLARAGLFFPHHFANGRTSRDALPSVLASVPAWMEESFSSSPYTSARLNGLGKALKEEGYKTSFFHGGKNGTMSFDILSRMAGFDRYVGLNEYPVSEDFDGNWGIFDEPFLRFMASELAKTSQPFAATVFTLSSHQPYTIPEVYKGKLKKGPLPVHEAVSYADQALRRFFAESKEMPWYSKTLFVLTADHTQERFEPAFSSMYGSFDVPLVFFCPGQKLEADTSRWVQHLDITPSVLELLAGPQKSANRLGRSIFQKSDGFPIQYQEGKYHLFHPAGILSWAGIDPVLDWLWSSEQKLTEPIGLRQMLVSRIQYYPGIDP